jgi:hypothetical protein
LRRIDDDFAGETLREAMPDSRLQKLLAAWLEALRLLELLLDFDGGSSFRDFLQESDKSD